MSGKLTWRTWEEILVVSHFAILVCSLMGFFERRWRAEGRFGLLQKARHVDQGFFGVSAMSHRIDLYVKRLST